MILLGSQSNNSVILGQKGLVHIVGQNNTQQAERLGISWIVRDPDGLLCEQYSDWSFDNDPGNDHEFIGGRFEFFKEGAYTIDAELLMNKDNPVVVDSYSGNLCTVGAVEPEPEPEPPPDEEPTGIPIWLYVGGGIAAAIVIALAVTRKKGPRR